MDITNLHKVADCIIKDLTEGNIINTCDSELFGFILACTKLAKVDNDFAEKIIKTFNREAGLQDYDDI